MIKIDELGLDKGLMVIEIQDKLDIKCIYEYIGALGRRERCVLMTYG